jgi:signal transduction histidine kinase
VTVRARADAGAGRIRVDVVDTGVGIDPADHAKVFEPFGQAGDTLTDKPRGTGLGLPICREIVERHGGELWLESAVGAGTTFSFTLPVASGRAAG